MPNEPRLTTGAALEPPVAQAVLGGGEAFREAEAVHQGHQDHRQVRAAQGRQEVRSRPREVHRLKKIAHFSYRKKKKTRAVLAAGWLTGCFVALASFDGAVFYSLSFFGGGGYMRANR